MKRKAFTLVELLVVIAIIALLMGILMPALARVRQIAHRMVCGTNLSGIGKAMLIYANDYDESYPVAGGRGAWWSASGSIQQWDAIDQPLEERAYGRMGNNEVTITSSLFLLVKYADLTTKQFVCKGDVGTKEFTLAEGGSSNIVELVEAWDFGNSPGGYCSYSYHMPYSDSTGEPGFPMTAISQPDSPVCADRNPFLDKNADYIVYAFDSGSTYFDTETGDFVDKSGILNAAAHQREGQNVLFNDSHVSFEKQVNVGVNEDNIWMNWGEDTPNSTIREQGDEGLQPTDIGCNTCFPWSQTDAFLVNEANGELPR